jgi:hypothetical protein
MGISTPNTARGTVPDKLLVVTQPEEELKQTIDGKTETAIAWGTTRVKTGKRIQHKSPKRGGGWHQYMADEYKEVPPGEETILNSGFTNIRLWTIDTRAEGGRAYKMIDEEGRYFDIREDLFLEAAYNGEIKQTKEGIVLTGTYVWVRAHSQMRVARVGSEIHKALLAAKERKNAKKIPGKEQVEGGVYMDKGGKLWVYIGRNRGADKKLGWVYAHLDGPYLCKWQPESVARREKWEALSLQEKWEYSDERLRRPCGSFWTTAKVVIEKVGDIKLGMTVEQSFRPPKYIDANGSKAVLV